MQQSSMNGGTVYVNAARPATKQYPWVLRALWYILIGWWATAIWITVAYMCCLLIFTLPAATWMFSRTNVVLTLQRIAD